MAEAAFDEMIGGHAADGGLVDFEHGEFRQEPSGAEVDCGDAQCGDGAGDGGVFDAGDDAVALPFFQPAWWLVATTLLIEIH